MFGIDPDVLKNLANLQAQITLFMTNTTVTLQRVEQRLQIIEQAQNDRIKNEMTRCNNGR